MWLVLETSLNVFTCALEVVEATWQDLQTLTSSPVKSLYAQIVQAS